MVAIGKLTIGDGCVLSEHVFLNDCSHGLNPLAGPIMRQRLVHGGDITIGKSCFLGYRASIMPGVILGEHCVVGANSVVTRSFPAYSMIVGAPAKLIKVFSLDRGEWIAPTS
jgi:acetyltransferase-like isoleucine patch superfamily enzyme